METDENFGEDGVIMEWSKEKPTEGGFYWVRGFYKWPNGKAVKFGPEIISAIVDNDIITILDFGDDEGRNLDNFLNPRAYKVLNAEFAGPIELPVS